MTFNFITPNPKTLISALTRSWFFCFLASLLTLFLIWGLLDLQAQFVLSDTQVIQQDIEKKQLLQASLKQELDLLNTQLQKIQDISKKNTATIQAIKNLFDLIPEQITIHSIALTEEALTMKGITPSKELYTFLLEAPLRAIFLESNVNFFVLPSGWYNFISVSKIDPKAQGKNND